MINKVFVRAPGNYDMDAVSDETGLKCEDKSLAKQSFAEECDINTIVRNFGLTGKLPDDVIRAPTFADFEGIFDYHSAMNSIVAAQESFEALPGDVRYRFHNDPGVFVEFCSKPENLAELRKMGLAPEVLLDPPAGGSPVKLDPSASPSGGLDSAAVPKP